jgi:hypothetical protein
MPQLRGNEPILGLNIDGPVTDKLGTDTDWYHWNIQKSAEKLNK